MCSIQRTLGARIIKLKITYPKYNRETNDIATGKEAPVYFKLACGIDFSIYDSGKIPVRIMNVYNECKARGVEVIFRERPPQHFRDNFGGIFTGIPQIFSPSFVDLPGRLIPFSNTSYFAPLVVENASQMNSYFQLLMKIEHVKNGMNLIDGNEIKVCSNKNDRGKVDFLPAFAPCWRSHQGIDCTHFTYSLGIFLPIADWIFTYLQMDIVGWRMQKHTRCNVFTGSRGVSSWNKRQLSKRKCGIWFEKRHTFGMYERLMLLENMSSHHNFSVTRCLMVN